MVDELDFHDGFVDGIVLSDQTARIFLRSVTGRRSTLELVEVEALLTTEFKQGNIILDLKLMSPLELDSDFVFNTYGYSEQPKKNFVLADWIESAVRKRLTALELTPSYGCSVSALFKSYKLVDGYYVG